MKCPKCGETDPWKVRELSEHKITLDITCGCVTCAHRWLVHPDGRTTVVYEGNDLRAGEKEGTVSIYVVVSWIQEDPPDVVEVYYSGTEAGARVAELEMREHYRWAEAYTFRPGERLPEESRGADR